MKNLIPLSFLLFLSCNTITNSENTKIIIENKEEIYKIQTMLKAQKDCWNSGDIKGFMKGYWNSEELVFTSATHKPAYGWKNTYKRYKESYPDKASMGKLSFKIIDIELLSDTTAELKGSWELIRQDDHPQGKFWLDLKKIKKNWVITKDSTISIL